MTDGEISDVILNAYDSVLNPDSWPGALTALANALGGRGAVLALREQGTVFSGFNEGCSYYTGQNRDLFDRYLREYAHHEAPAWKKLESYATGTVMRDTDMGLSLDQMDAEPHYAFTLEKLGIRRRIAFRVNDNRGWVDGFAVAFDASLDAFPAGLDARVALLTPHLGKAVEMARVFALLKQRYQSVLNSLDRLDIGIAIALPTGEIIVSNNEADRMFDAGDVLALGPGRKISLRQSDLNAGVRAAIDEASQTARGENNALAAPIQLERSAGRAPVLLDISSLRTDSSETGDTLNGALLTMIDMERPPALDVQRFAKLYGMTKAEAEVCALIAEGHSNAMIAEKRNTSPHTVHNQIRSIFTKTAIKNRSALLRLIVKTLPPIL